jgi:dTDP-glucose 4,6-dehydratase
MNLLVTGAAGFIGSNFVRWWRAHRPQDDIVGLDLLTDAAVPANLEGLGVDLVRADIGDTGVVERELRQRSIDTVVNFAAESHNSWAVLDPTRFFRTNVLGTVGLLEACRRVRGVRLHHVSTCEVYGDLALDDPGAFSEGSPYRPGTPYSASKAGGDHAVRAYRNTFGLPVTITNCCNNYGPFQFPEKVIPVFVTRAIRGQPLPLYASTANRREWIHVDDHCAAIARVIDRGTMGETYNVGTGVERSIEEIADLVLDELGLPGTLKSIVPDRPGHDRRYRLDWTKIRTELAWKPAVEFDLGLRVTVRWYVEHKAWWEGLLSRRSINEEAWAER